MPVTLADGRKAQLVIPCGQRKIHTAYKCAMAAAPSDRSERAVAAVMSRERPRWLRRERIGRMRNKRSWEKEALIVGASAGPARSSVALQVARRRGGRRNGRRRWRADLHDLATRDRDRGRN